LTPGRYVGTKGVANESAATADKIGQLTATLREQFFTSATLEERVVVHLDRLAHSIDESWDHRTDVL
jgi:hypothetical protein